MTLRCKAGDLALVVKHCPGAPTLIGRVVDVISFVPASTATTLNGEIWFAYEDGWVVTVDRPVFVPHFGVALDQVVIHDSALLPIITDPEPAAIPTDVREGEHA